MSPLSTILVPLLVLLINSVEVVESQPATFSADISAPTNSLSRTVLDSFGSSHGSTTLRATWRTHFDAALNEIGFNRVRFHGILDDDLSTYLNGKANGALVFDTLDYLVARNIRPTIEIGFMPQDLARNSSLKVFHYQGGADTFADATKWSNFITDFVGLLLDRYGAATVREWFFEV